MAIETTIYTPRTLGKLITRMPPCILFSAIPCSRTAALSPRRALTLTSRKEAAPSRRSFTRKSVARWFEQRLSDEDLHPRSAGP